ncbi:PhnD/SsuA/transferrin family substrate-binding protein [Thermoflexus hugenholtzii]|uniref:Phosphonate transport system substrate-binding protein n=1 Tax=Thermoflexus hugenholtzii JAD2 TaxID=877466 RepID=A0A212QV48_9CHLR|nr:PhnD/SsuA/transferrin family substrate-binding protein [Thermoflexus hugenholtzii]SNB63557.1 phosphonate transport system substrate-binding protein [Thermoflexus hugenholtzii JAD2]
MRGMPWQIFLVFVLVACQREPAIPVRLSESLLPSTALRVSLEADGPWIWSFDRRLEPKEDIRMNASLLRWLERQTGLRFRLRMAPRGQSVADEICAGRVHFGIVGTVTYLQAYHRCGARILVRGRNREGQDTYRAAIVVPPDSPIRDLADLRGRSFAFGSPNSTQGHLIPRLMLQRAGLTLHDLRAYAFHDSHAATANAVISGRYDAGGLQDTLALALAERGLVRILVLSEPYPSSGIIAGPGVPEKTAQMVREALLTLDPVGRDRAFLYHWERSEMPLGFAPARDEEYADLYWIAREIGLLEP